MHAHHEDAHFQLAPHEVSDHLAEHHAAPTGAQLVVTAADIAQLRASTDTGDWSHADVVAAILHKRLHLAAGDW